MKKILLIITIIVLSAYSIFSQVKRDTATINHIKKIESRLKVFEEKLKEAESTEESLNNINDKIDLQQKFNEQTLNGISLQLGVASYNLTIFGILFALAAIGLGVYVTYVERKVVKIGYENQELLLKNQKIKEDIEEINRLIQSDIYNLFLKIKREETTHILDRLIIIPKDIANVGSALLSREILKEDFPKLRKAFMNLQEQEHDQDYIFQYYSLFFQHFFHLALKDDEIRNQIKESIPDCINSSFENDIIKSTQDFAYGIDDIGILPLTDVITQFFEGLENSRYSNFKEVYKTLFENLSRKNRFEIWHRICSNSNLLMSKISYCKLVQEKYETENLNEVEEKFLKEINSYLNDQEEKSKGSAEQVSMTSTIDNPEGNPSK